MAWHEMTFPDASRIDAIAGDVDAAFVMDEETFRAFYDRNARAVWVYLARITGDRQLADDLLQDAFYRFLRARAAHENEAHRRNSLFRIATNLARDAHRRRRTQPALDAGHDPDLVPGRSDDAGGRVERTTDVQRAMAQLKPRERALLWLAYAEGSSHREIADALGVKTASVKLLLFRARRRIARLLGARGGHAQAVRSES
jgi:RNA polymerase sigma-70 factor (ECF subfamily)